MRLCTLVIPLLLIKSSSNGQMFQISFCNWVLMCIMQQMAVPAETPHAHAYTKHIISQVERKKYTLWMFQLLGIWENNVVELGMESKPHARMCMHFQPMNHQLNSKGKNTKKYPIKQPSLVCISHRKTPISLGVIERQCEVVIGFSDCFSLEEVLILSVQGLCGHVAFS